MEAQRQAHTQIVTQMEANHTMMLKEMTKLQRMLSRSLS